MRIILSLGILSICARVLLAQSIVAGSVGGAVLDQFERPIAEARVVITASGSEASRTADTRRSGLFAFLFLPPGEYGLAVEALGYQPAVIRRIQVRPGRSVPVTVHLERGLPPFDEPAVIDVREGALGMSLPGAAWWTTDLELSRLPDQSRDLAEVARFTSVSSETLDVEGLPGQLSGIVIDGVHFTGITHPAAAEPFQRTIAFPRSGFERGELVTNGLDVEWSGFPGATLSGHTRRGTSEFQVRVFGDWFGDALAASKHFDPKAVEHNSLRGGLMIQGPIVRDTAHFAVGIEARNLELAMPSVWEATPLDAEIVSVANDSFGVDLGPSLAPRLVTTKTVAGFARVDWSVSKTHSLNFRANFASLSQENFDLGWNTIPGLGTEVTGSDVSVGAGLTSHLSPVIVSELRVGLEVLNREYTSTGISGTQFSGGPVAFGTDPSLLGNFDRVAFQASEIIHFFAGLHRFKFGGAATLASNTYAYDFRPSGVFNFSGVNEFAQLQGGFRGADGVLPAAEFTTSQFGGFIQDRWTAAPGLDITFGFRVDVELLSDDDIALDQTWQNATGLQNNDIRDVITKISPRLGFSWNVAGSLNWLLHGEFGMYNGVVDPALFGELVALNGQAALRHELGTLGGWPDPSSPTSSTVTLSSLTLPGPEFAPPRTQRASAGISGAIARATTLHLSATVRHTDFLPRRHDLNLSAAPTTVDRDDRPIYGTLTKQGSMVSVVPGSNRLFPNFDLVSALDPDGASDYWGVTVRLERRVAAALNLIGSYTVSQTEDNWLAPYGSPDRQLTPFPDSLDGQDWADGVSDLDVPNRVTVGAELDFGRVQLAGFYRYSSGRPFTPGFRPGVDVNGDGSSRNDPAFIDDAITGTAELVAAWDCLRDNLGQFSQRNSCRTDGVSTLDLRAVLSPIRVGNYPFSVVIDALNVLDSDVGDPDRAVYLVDPNLPLVTDPNTGVVSVPLVANPNFGALSVRRTTGRKVRIGVRVNYE